MLVKWSPVEGANYYEVAIHGPDGYFFKQEVLPLNLEGHQYVLSGLWHNAEHEIFVLEMQLKKMTGQKPAECCKEIDSFEEEICYDSEDEIV